jgi:hypothetical protein
VRYEIKICRNKVFGVSAQKITSIFLGCKEKSFKALQGAGPLLQNIKLQNGIFV